MSKKINGDDLLKGSSTTINPNIIEHKEYWKILLKISAHFTRKIVTSSAVIALLTYSIIGNGGVKNFQQL